LKTIDEVSGLTTIAIDAAPLGSGRGGDETSLLGMLSGLTAVAPADLRFVVLLPDDTQTPDPIAHHAAFDVHRIPRAGGLRRLTVTVPRALRRIEPDLVLAFNHGPLWTSVPLALVVADVSFLRYPDHYPMSTRLRLRMLIRRQASRAAIVITVSEFSRGEIIELLGIPAGRVAVVPNAVALPPLPSTQDAAAGLVWLRDQGIADPFVLYLGNLHPRKNLGRLARGFLLARSNNPAVAQASLVVAGRTWWTGQDGDDWRRLVTNSAGAIAVIGPVTDSQKDTLLREAAAVAYPSLYEGFGLPPLEAMARSTPVLASNAGSLPEILGDAALLVDPLDVDAIRDGIVRILTDVQLRSRLVDAGRTQASQYSSDRTGTALIAALRAAMSGLPASAGTT
jgi:glycosyltransferase involved in cell wall biosynthesis